MKERPILFSAEMIRALLRERDGKTQTRRVVKPDWWRCLDPENEEDRAQALTMCPYGAPGDRLWVREAWAPVDYLVATELEDPVCIGYRATETAICHESGNVRAMDTYAFPWDRIKWRPSIHMPRWASRIDLELTSVRVEQVQDISEEDARAEGVDYYVPGEGFVSPAGLSADPGYIGQGSYRAGFEILWDEINGKRPGCSWADSPWVWVLGFRRPR